MATARFWNIQWSTVTRIETAKIIPWIALRNTIGVTAPLALGVAIGQVSAGVVMGMGALNVAFSDGKDPYQQRARRMLLASFFCALSVALGSSTGRDSVAATLVAAVWALSAGMMVALGTTPGDIATVSLVVMVVFAAQPMTPERALLSGVLAFAGGLFQTLLSVTSWLHRRYEPERRVLGELYASLKSMIESHVDASAAPPATPQSSEAGKALATLGRDYSLEGERYRALLNQAERIRLSILVLKRLRARMRREPEECPPEPLDRVLEIASMVCTEVSRLLRHETVSIEAGVELAELPALEKAVTRDTGLGHDASFQIAALAGQLRSAVSLASHSIGAGLEAFERQEARKPLALRLTSSLATLRANLSLRSPAFRHALRLACSIGLGVALGRGFGLVRPYWIPMTIAIVLKPDFSTTFSRGVLRLAGTYLGLLLATGLFHVMSPTHVEQIALLAAFTFLCRCFGPANYGILTAAVSGLVVLLIALSGVGPRGVIAARALNTTIGGLLALIAYALWPTWERTQLPQAMADMLDGYRRYFKALTQCCLEPKGGSQELDACRLDARLKRSSMEASVERYRAEPGADPAQLDRVMSMLASSHRFAHAAMSLEAEMAANPSRAIPEGFRPFVAEVNRTLGLLAATLRGLRPPSASYPDLRAAHNRLLESGGPSLALLNTETDRVTNSLNTLREQVQAWIGDAGSGPGAEPPCAS